MTASTKTAWAASMPALPAGLPSVVPSAAAIESGCMSKLKSKEEKSFITNTLDNLWCPMSPFLYF